MKVLIADDDVYKGRASLRRSNGGGWAYKRFSRQKTARRRSRWRGPTTRDCHTDVRMPKLNGIEFAERLSAVCPECKRFISGYMEVAYMKSAIRLAAVDYVEKPIKLQEMEKAIGRTIGYIRERKEREALLNQKVDMNRRKLAIALRTGGIARMK